MKPRMKAAIAAAAFIALASACEGDATTQQNGDNSSVVSQRVEATSGDAVPGSQVVGIVGDGVVQASNSATGADATTGTADAQNELTGGTGPSASAEGEDGGSYTASASQVGDNHADISQVSLVGSGDAVSGGQITGAVDGNPLFQVTNTATDPSAESGSIVEGVGDFTGNEADVFVGPRASISALLGTVVASSNQIGDNAAFVGQAVDATTGDAIAGSQISGSVGGSPTVQSSNTSLNDDATSGDADAFNELYLVVGPQVSTNNTTALVEQIGSNIAEVGQFAESATGDAISGGQVVGTVASDATIQNTNNSDGSTSISGDSSATNLLDLNVGPSYYGVAVVAKDYSASQIGDNKATASQRASSRSGDSVSGSQVSGNVSGNGTNQGSNNSSGSSSTSGQSSGSNNMDFGK